jgi:hypothetical protein
VSDCVRLLGEYSACTPGLYCLVVVADEHHVPCLPMSVLRLASRVLLGCNTHDIPMTIPIPIPMLMPMTMTILHDRAVGDV